MTSIRKTSPRLWEPTYLLNRALSRDIAAALAEGLPAGEGARLLDVGCGLQPYRRLFDGRVSDYVGCDLYPSDPSIVSCPADGLAFPDEAFDFVACFQVLEHVPRPWAVVRECARVLKPGGAVLVTAPFIYPHHPSPTDFFRFTHEGLQALVEDAGLEVHRLDAQCGSLATLCMLASLYTAPLTARLARLPLMRLPAAGLQGLIGIFANASGLACSAAGLVRPFRKGLTGYSNHLILAGKAHAPRD